MSGPGNPKQTDNLYYTLKEEQIMKQKSRNRMNNTQIISFIT